MVNPFFDSSLEYLKGVGPLRASLLYKELGLKSFKDLLYFFPFRYIDRSRFCQIKDINNANVDIQIYGEVKKIELQGFGKKKRLIVTFTDNTGSIELIFFKRIPWIKKQINLSTKYVVFGKPNLFNRKYSIVHPEIELYDKIKNLPKHNFHPVYHSTDLLRKNNLNSKGILKLINELFKKSSRFFAEENLSQAIIEKNQLITRKEALLNIHFPNSEDILSKAIFRLKFEELFFLQLLILKDKSSNKKNKSFKFSRVGDNFNRFFYDSLSFQLTNAQKKVMKEIRKDLLSGFQMNRLVQGDVGSGKTIIAIMSFMICVDNGFQACLMVPTEVLAFQHYNNINDLCKNLDLNISLLTGSTKSKDKKSILTDLKSGKTNIIVGTHSLIQDSIQFKSLGLLVIDEQHKFGVAQRAKLSNQGKICPHIMILTATPIPRTLAMTFYGDLDVSTINEMPPGRKPVKTIHKFDKDTKSIFSFLKEKIDLGQQAYIIYPLIEESEKLDYKNLLAGYKNLETYFLNQNIHLSMLHGKMSIQEKTKQMESFLAKKTQIMVSTTVIEVGLDVKNASVMLIENAERFGLSQLHQLRGRVGRGNVQSYCILKTPYKLSYEAKYRINVLVESCNGFDISEADLKLRGPGDIMGTKQSGLLNLKIANLVKDESILILARNIAKDLLKVDSELKDVENNIIRKYLVKNFSHKIKWMKIS